MFFFILLINQLRFYINHVHTRNNINNRIAHSPAQPSTSIAKTVTIATNICVSEENKKQTDRPNSWVKNINILSAEEEVGAVIFQPTPFHLRVQFRATRDFLDEFTSYISYHSSLLPFILDVLFFVTPFIYIIKTSVYCILHVCFGWFARRQDTCTLHSTRKRILLLQASIMQFGFGRLENRRYCVLKSTVHMYTHAINQYRI